MSNIKAITGLAGHLSAGQGGGIYRNIKASYVRNGFGPGKGQDLLNVRGMTNRINQNISDGFAAVVLHSERSELEMAARRAACKVSIADASNFFNDPTWKSFLAKLENGTGLKKIPEQANPRKSDRARFESSQMRAEKS